MSDCMFINANFRVNQTFESYAEIMNLDMTITDKSYFKAFFDKIGSVEGKEIIDFGTGKYKSVKIWTEGDYTVLGDIKLNFCFIDDNGDKNYLSHIIDDVYEDRFCMAAADVIQEMIEDHEEPFEAYMTRELETNQTRSSFEISFNIYSVKNVSFDSKYGHVDIMKATFTQERYDIEYFDI